MSSKHRVTVQDVPEEEHQRLITSSSTEFDPIAQADRTGAPSETGDTGEAGWREMDRMEQQARKERASDPQERENAVKTANIIKEHLHH